MGRAGIRRRKPRRRLPPPEVPSENDLVPPNIMWPGAGSGFEANPFSPAGRAQQEWQMLQRLDRLPRGVRLLLVAPFLALLAWALVAAVVDIVF